MLTRPRLRREIPHDRWLGYVNETHQQIIETGGNKKTFVETRYNGWKGRDEVTKYIVT